MDSLVQLIQYIRFQRHDFINHLQVISGYVQLNMLNEVREYIGKITSELHERAGLLRLPNPRLVAVLLGHELNFERREIKVRWSLPLDASSDVVIWPGIADVFDVLLSGIQSLLLPAGFGCPAPEVVISFRTEGGTCCWQIDINNAGSIDEHKLGEIAEEAGARVSGTLYIGWQLLEEGFLQIHLMFSN